MFFMKKLFALFTALILVLSASVTAFADPGKFIYSPSRNSAPELLDYSNSDPNCVARLKVTIYADRDSLSEDERNAFEAAYNEIVNANDIADLNSDIAKVAKDKGIPTANLAVSDLFNISCEDDAGHDQHGTFTIKLKAETFKNFVGLMYFDGSEWHYVEDAVLDSDGNLTFTAKEVGPFAVVVNAGENGSNVPSVNGDTTGKSPQTGDDFSALWIVLMVASAAGLGVVAFIFVKQNRKAKR